MEDHCDKILQSALASIRIGLHDYESTDPVRKTLAATRNIYAGILLLIKHKLCILSPEDKSLALVKKAVLPQLSNNKIQWIGDGRSTVNFQAIQERCISLDVKVDWNALKEIQGYRNSIEHYFSTDNEKRIESIISNSFVIIRNFITHELKKEADQLLDAKSWKILVSANKVYEIEREKCEGLIRNLNYYHDLVRDALLAHSCSDCASNLIKPTATANLSADASFKCLKCSTILSYDEIIKIAIPAYYVSKGKDYNKADCPECINGTFLYHERICASCGAEPMMQCARCGLEIPADELHSSPYCGGCENSMSKD